MAGALSGIRVIDFGQYVAGPLAAMLLADQGADVIRIDPPGGPRLVTPANAVWNRGKRSIVLDLANEEDRSVARELVSSADVVVENFRPGVMARLGLGYESLSKANPGLIYCSLPGFGSSDSRASVAAWEGVVEAAVAGYTKDGSDRPVYSAVPVSSVYAAILGAVSVVMSLNARGRDEQGQHIEVPLYDATFVALGSRAQFIHNSPDDAIAIANRRGLVSWLGEYECSDGRYVFFHAGNKKSAEFIDVIGGTGLLDQPDGMDRIRDLFKTKTAREWEDLGDEIGTEMVRCLSSAEWLREPHFRETGMSIEVDDPRYGPTLQPGVQVYLSDTPGAVGAPGSEPDADRDEVLAALSKGRPVDDVLTDGAVPLRSALEGVKVLDLTILLAGPSCGRTLAEFGANVIKVDNPAEQDIAEVYRPLYRSFRLDTDRGKRSIAVDLKTPEGVDLFWKLAADADVIVQNFRGGVMDRLGLGYEAVKARHPNIVYASINTYGVVGPWKGRPGHEHLGQSSSGMTVRFGGEGAPTLQNIRAECDYGTGLLGSFAVALALLERQRTGQGQQVNSALSATGALLQSPYMFDYPGRVWGEPKGQDALGPSTNQRLYQTSNGWIFVGLRSEDVGHLSEIEGLGDVAGLSGHDVAAQLENCFLKEDCATWVRRLNHGRIGAHRVTSLAEVMRDAQARSRNLIVTNEHEGLGPVDQVGAIPRLSRTPTATGSPATDPGARGREVLAEHGLDDQLERLVKAGAVSLPEG
jgi:crotonobetainyl-CoA:carnitine CoA-transferase CaiB-like acyl-CoA transferase